MKHAKKMVLVDFEEAGKIHDKGGNVVEVNQGNKMSEGHAAAATAEKNFFEQNILNILSSKNLDDYEKSRFNNELLRRFAIKKEDSESLEEKHRNSFIEKLVDAVGEAMKSKFVQSARKSEEETEPKPFEKKKSTPKASPSPGLLNTSSKNVRKITMSPRYPLRNKDSVTRSSSSRASSVGLEAVGKSESTLKGAIKKWEKVPQ